MLGRQRRNSLQRKSLFLYYTLDKLIVRDEQSLWSHRFSGTFDMDRVDGAIWKPVREQDEVVRAWIACGWGDQSLGFVRAVIDCDSEVLGGRIGGAERIGTPLASHFLDSGIDDRESGFTGVADGDLLTRIDRVFDDDMTKFGSRNMLPEELAEKIARLETGNERIRGKVEKIQDVMTGIEPCGVSADRRWAIDPLAVGRDGAPPRRTDVRD